MLYWSLWNKMKKRIFKYRAVGIILFLIELFVAILFGYGATVSFEDFENVENLTLDHIVFPFALLIFLTSLLCLISLVLKGKKTVMFLNIHYIIIAIFFAFGFMKQLYEGAVISEDLTIFIVVFSVLAVLLFIINFFKYKRIDFLEIDEIGTQNLN